MSVCSSQPATAAPRRAFAGADVPRCVAALLASVLLLGSPAHAQQIDIANPAGSGGVFGDRVAALPNGNILVTDPQAGSSKQGAVYLFSPSGALISTLTGSSANDRVGQDILVLASGNAVVCSSAWSNGSVANVGAATFIDANTGVSGVVSAANSLIGSHANDTVCDYVVPLPNGNYLVASPRWANGAVDSAGAVTWANGNTGLSGVVSPANSLVGSSSGDQVGDYIALLSNGNYVVAIDGWTNAGAVAAGAVTWGNANGGTIGPVSSSNSLVGSTAGDYFGITVKALSNGDYVVATPHWHNGSLADAGLATLGSASGRIRGVVGPGNSLIGSKAGDQVGLLVTALHNGNAVINSNQWSNGSATAAGAVTWMSGTMRTAGVVSTANSLVGSKANDQVGLGGVTALSTGNYVVSSPAWSTASVSKVGAATWADGSAATAAAVSAANSLIGSQANDQVGYFGSVALSNGNYVVVSTQWANGSATLAGAVTWANGSGPLSAVVSSANSLVGTRYGDMLGVGDVRALSNGNYVVASPYWNSSTLTGIGAVTWVDGSVGRTGSVSSGNSLLGSTTNDAVGYDGSTALSNGDYVIGSRYWHNGANYSAGAITWANGANPLVGVVSNTNSLVGNYHGDELGDGGMQAVGRGNYVVSNWSWSDGGTLTGAGAVSLGRGTGGNHGQLQVRNSVLGTVANGLLMSWDYDATRDQLVVGRPSSGIVTLFKENLLFSNSFELQ